MPTTSLKSNAPNQNYNDPNNWTNGAPVATDTVVIAVAPPNGPEIATNTAIVGQTILLMNNGSFYTAGTSSFDATTTLTDQNGATNQDLEFGFNFTNAGVINNANYILIGTQSSQTPAPSFVNNGVMNYMVNLGGNSLSAYLINGFNSSGAAEFINNGTINVTTPAGANEGPTATTLVTQVQITGTVTGSGAVNVDGSTQNSLVGPSPTAPTESVIEFEQDVTGGAMTFNLNDGEAQFDGASSGTVNFQDASGIVDLANVVTTPTALTFFGFRAGDAIGLGTQSITSAAYDTTTKLIDLFNGATMVGALNLQPSGTQNYATSTFTIATSLAADTLLPTSNSTRNQVYLETNAAAPCYCPGTLIRTDRGEVAVEALAIGNRVITLDGSAEPIKWIGRRAYDGRFVEGRRDIQPVCVRAGALGNGLPRRDLFVSPLHAMFLRGVLVPAGDLVNGVSIVQESAAASVEYIHIELDRHQIIWAEGAASESFVDDDSRAMFHNAHEFASLFPDDVRTPAAYFAPRVRDGEAVEAIRREIDLRAGLFVPGAGKLRGSVDGLQGAALRGWAQNPDEPEAPVCLDVLIDGAVVARTVANLFRQDLRAAGLGSGCHGFHVDLPARAAGGALSVRRVADGAVVGTPAIRGRRAA